MKLLRRALLECWGIVVLAGIVGFLGPFGTYGMGDFLWRWWRWWLLMAGAWTTMRPIVAGCRWIADRTGLPRSALVFWGMVLASFPLALVWRLSSAEETRLFGGYAGLLSFTLLCAAAVAGVAWWAVRADRYLLDAYRKDAGGQPARQTANPVAALPPDALPPDARSADARSTALLANEPARPRLHERLGPGFAGEVLALESEDHYVRVHGHAHSVLLLMRLRDAIAEMDGCPGEQTHRSWWVARAAIAGTASSGRNRELLLINGLRVPIARASADRLRETGCLPA